MPAIRPNISEKKELFAARVAIAVAVVAAGLAGLNPPGFVAQVVALAFGLAASSFFPAHAHVGAVSRPLRRASAADAVAAMQAALGASPMHVGALASPDALVALRGAGGPVVPLAASRVELAMAGA